ncbi:MAG TPA: PPC domain-containing protein, partial [Myxococcota bacterium]
DPPFVCGDDAAEPDDDPAAAPVLALTSSITAQPRTMCADEEDLLSVPLLDFQTLVVSARYLDSDVTLAVDVLDATGTTVKKTSPPAVDGAAVSYDAVGNETVLVRIRGVGGAIGPYTLDVSRENQLSCLPDDGEPNDTPATAGPLPPAGTLLNICGSDEDYFAITGTAGKKLVADASFRQADGDIDLILLGLDGAQILAAAEGQSDGEHLEYVLPLDGTYTLRVFSLTNNARARYTLDVTQVSP